jgi:hypothetical protein
MAMPKYFREVLLGFCTTMCTITLYFMVMTEARVQESITNNNKILADFQDLRDKQRKLNESFVDMMKSTSDIALKANERAAVLEAKQIVENQ